MLASREKKEARMEYIRVGWAEREWKTEDKKTRLRLCEKPGHRHIMELSDSAKAAESVGIAGAV
jgi:hypothetical protein